jgi:hypothetical protein
MTIRHQAVRYGQRRLARRLSQSLPWVGAVLAVATLGAAIRRKGFLGGTFDTALNAIPFIGGVKTAAEVVRGRDFIRDRRLPGKGQTGVVPGSDRGRTGVRSGYDPRDGATQGVGTNGR